MTAALELDAKATPRLGVSRSRRVQTSGGREGQWWTPAWLAALLASWAGLETRKASGHPWRVLDAGAGMGALSVAALEHHVDVTMVERDERLAIKLEQLVERSYADRARVRAGNFLSRAVRQTELFDAQVARAAFDVVLSNPPWERDLPERFIVRGLELSSRVCAIVPLNMLCGGKRAAFWDSVDLTRVKALPRRPLFHGDRGGMRDVMLVEVRPRRATSAIAGARLEVG